MRMMVQNSLPPNTILPFVAQKHVPWHIIPMTSPPPRRRPGNPTLTTPFELFYGEKPDYCVLFKWGSVGYYRRDSDSGIKRGNFDMQTNVGIALGRSNQTNAMLFWIPALPG
jgi:hypothetical protein